MIFSEQENANYFLLISSSSLNTVKFQNRQNNLFFTKDVWAILLKAIFFFDATQASQRIGGVIVSSRLPLSLDLTRICTKDQGKMSFFNKRKKNVLIFLTWLNSIQNETNKKTIESFCLVRMQADGCQSTKTDGSAK